MWIAELSRRTDVPVPTIKYYLREGLLAPGESVGATRARYGEEHIRRLRLIRALVEAGGLSLARVRGVLAAVDEEERELHEVLGAAHAALLPEHLVAEDTTLDRVDRLIKDRGWHVDTGSPDRVLLAGALDALERVGYHLDDALLDVYATAADEVGTADVAHLPSGEDRPRTVESTVIVTALGAPVLLALRRLAQQNASAERFGHRH
ncbi:DNA-binding transcriptional MerR regulator [Kribbella amoyensis]|uniref:DNA-binding transcriptional MerR regulator n=1 Tax=Kribbella amoyensis TaxID=996641 RepID=A0A561BNV3_9ACTN|nr:MerR family transcriptional regulator [Kribbella amoyensis]TWD80544.1 DNA-binding transcriptional MerR regulator [Kribbella amoyensis]